MGKTLIFMYILQITPAPAFMSQIKKINASGAGRGNSHGYIISLSF